MGAITAKNDQLQIRVTSKQKKRLKHAAEAAKVSVSEWVLSRLFAQDEERFQNLVTRLAGGSNRKLVLAEVNDFLTGLTNDDFLICIASPPSIALSPFLANYLAAMVEVAAHKKQLHPPVWTKNVPPLSKPYFGTTLESLRLYLLTHSPPPFRKRNIFIDASVGDRV